MRRLLVPSLACLLAAGCATAPLVTLRDGPAHHAWWLRTDFHPRGRDLHGIPAGELREGWCAVDALTASHFDGFERADGRDPAAADAPAYAVRGPDVDGRETRLMLVAFRECDGTTGTAMLLIEHHDRGPARLHAVEVLASPAAYAMLGEAGPGRVHVVHCQECDVVDEYAWSPQERRFVPVPAPEPDGS